jgi:hypothetical protein
MGRVKQPAIRRQTSETITSNGVLHQDVNGLIHEPKEQLSKAKEAIKDAAKGEPGLGSLLFCVGGIYASL